MTTDKLYEFYVLSQALNYSLAAKNLYISQSTLSRHIKEMEAELGQELFHRSTHQMTLTKAGAYLAKTVSPLINKCNQTESMMQIRGLSTTGSIHIGCALEISYASHISVFIHRFMERYPQINVQFEVLSAGIPPEMLLHYDLVFSPCEYPALPSSIKRVFLFSHKVYLAVPPGHRLMFQQPVRLSDLTGETLLIPFLEESFGPYAKNHNMAVKYCHGNLISLGVPNIHTALFLVTMKQGISIIPKYAHALSPNELFLVEIENKDCCFNEYLYSNEASDNPSAQLFFEELCATYEEAIF